MEDNICIYRYGEILHTSAVLVGTIHVIQGIYINWREPAFSSAVCKQKVCLTTKRRMAKEMLKSYHTQMDGTKAVGIDGITKEEYGRSLEENINALIERLKKKSYKPKPARLVEIPKDNGKM